jgi:hypothetical protein
MNVTSVTCHTLYCFQNSDGETSKQLEYILKLHRGDCQPDHSSTSDEENADDDTVSQGPGALPLWYVIQFFSGLTVL